ncbi:MAG: PhoH family protein [Candidatus Omnitrophica bacterium]|nr:PhoH family protein [Candidatus Omnitrophota bacterium]
MEKLINIKSVAEAQKLFGTYDGNLSSIEKEFKVKLSLRNNFLKLKGSSHNISKAAETIEYILNTLRSRDYRMDDADLRYFIKDPKHSRSKSLFSLKNSEFSHSSASREKQAGPRTPGQREYVEAIRKFDIVFGIGPAGTGKTYLAMACAVEALKNQNVRRIILTRPAIEAGESLGFLPGDMYEKISPYLRPLYDALYDMMEAERIEKYLETGIIEVAPLAYMRGRTLNEAFIILDEAQNATAEQMKMFLTRLGFDSKAVITGDITQSDLPDGKPLGLLKAQKILKDVEGIKLVNLTGADVVRHELVQKVIEAYARAENSM